MWVRGMKKIFSKLRRFLGIFEVIVCNRLYTQYFLHYFSIFRALCAAIELCRSNNALKIGKMVKNSFQSGIDFRGKPQMALKETFKK